jgi:hypothetical protein
MNGIDVLVDILDHFSFVLPLTISDLSSEALQWQPDPLANNIAVTVWHICRALDVLAVKILSNQPDSKQLWYSQGWVTETGYAPAGLGIGGFGNVAGYTQEQVKEIPHLSANELLAYFDQVYTALKEILAKMGDDGLQKPPPGWPDSLNAHAPEDCYSVILAFLLDNREHLGEIKAIKAMWQRKFQTSS